MIPLPDQNKKIGTTAARFTDEPYLVINMIFAGIIILILGYSLIFSPEKNDYPVPCIHEKITGEKCASCGLSHSLSLIVRGRIKESYTWNDNGMRVFLFLMAQLLMRLSFSRSWHINPESRIQLILFDVTGSTVLFFITFIPFILYILRWL